MTGGNKAPNTIYIKMHLQNYGSSIHAHDRMLHTSCTAEQIGALITVPGAHVKDEEGERRG